MTLNPSSRDKALAALRAIVGPVRGQSGCTECHLYQDAEDECRFYLVEVWKNQDALERRLKSPAYLNVLEILEMAACAPEIEFDEVTGRRGIELVRAVREQRD